MPAAVRPSEDAINQNLTAVNNPAAKPQRRPKKVDQFTVVESISRPTPSWLPWIRNLRKATTPLALVSLASVMGLYGITSMVEREWGTQYQTLDSLQTQRDTLITQVEKSKYRIPRELEIEPKNFVDLNQTNTLFVRPEPPSTTKAAPAPRPHSLLREDRMLIGY